MKGQRGKVKQKRLGVTGQACTLDKEVITLSAPYEWQLCKYELEWNQDN